MNSGLVVPLTSDLLTLVLQMDQSHDSSDGQRALSL